MKTAKDRYFLAWYEGDRRIGSRNAATRTDVHNRMRHTLDWLADDRDRHFVIRQELNAGAVTKALRSGNPWDD